MLVANRVVMEAEVDAAILADPAGRAAKIWGQIVERFAQGEGQGAAPPTVDLTPRRPEADR